MVGQSPWRGPHDVWLEKTGRAKPREENELMEWGRYVEPAIVSLWRRRTGRTGRQVRFTGRHQRTIQHPDHPLLSATPDGLVDPDATLEVKSYGYRLEHHWGEPGTDAVPDYYLTQVTLAMACTGRKRAYVVAEHERQVDEYIVEYDHELAEALADRCEQFWHDHVVTDTPPPVDHSDRCRLFLQQYYPRPIGNKVMMSASSETDEIARHLFAAEQAEAAAQQDKQLAQNRLKDRIGDAYGVHTALGKVLWYGVSGRVEYSAKELLRIARELGATDEQLADAKRVREGHRVLRAYWAKK